MNRAAKINLLTSIVQGKLTTGQVAALKKSREPIKITLKIDDGITLPPRDPNEPTYHIHINYGDGEPSTGTAFWRYPDGRVEYVKS